jgi:hypothetical protein
MSAKLRRLILDWTAEGDGSRQEGLGSGGEATKHRNTNATISVVIARKKLTFAINMVRKRVKSGELVN